MGEQGSVASSILAEMPARSPCEPLSKTKRQALARSEEVALSVGGVRSSQLDTLARHGEARAWQLKWFAVLD